MPNFLADLHAHTIGSLHAYSTVKENILACERQGVRFMAVTDHLYYHEDRMQRNNEIARIANLKHYCKNSDVLVISGVECNLGQPLSYDDSREIIKNCRWRLVGNHNWFLDTERMSVTDLPALFERSLDKNDPCYVKPTAFAHIERGLFGFGAPTDVPTAERVLRQIVDIAVDNGIYLEINEYSLNMDAQTKSLMTGWVEYAIRQNANFCLGTDAHYCDQVGNFAETDIFLNNLGVPYDRILNCHYNSLVALAGR